ncbi:16S rRNA (cytidine(1402)-2'-O)-methyltransferase [Solobacterium moorei]|uniref:Ribosomal RNA small subunit methyltransferase I n=1 Tax=Solobacterium moorei TaxID=102148 RepID=A0A412PHK8_9FIRM|nr:16S rRNA (cytidine(1402)-2'-O)-methyltransferase [Solobacterium moorei]RGT57649.1 16S rRNA (cytidine(1402)-2'-O)-methyltransferase [Solobacterium moorei]
MNRQKSFENEKPTLYLVPTPIGNLNEMTPRAIDVLNSVDVIACEDTRNSGQLLKHFDISKRLIAYQNFNEASSTKGIINLLSQGNNIALISDAGYPLINDPGQRVVSEVTALGYNVVPISGCSAFLNALVASGLIVQPFIFIGFLPPSTHDCVKKLRLYQSYPMTLIMYEAPHRIEKMLQSCLDVLGDRHICIGRELTKVHEEFIRGTISEILPIASELKGEMVVVIEGNQDDYEKDIDMGQILNMVNTSIKSGMSTSAAIKEVAKQTGIPKNQIYDLVHGKTDQKGVC